MHCECVSCPTPSFERQARQAAFQAGLALYGIDLVHRNSDVQIRRVSDRIKEEIEQDTDPCVIGLVDDFEYAFTMDHRGLEASGLAITDEKLRSGNNKQWVLLYCPEYGIDALYVDMTTEEMYKYIRLQTV